MVILDDEKLNDSVSFIREEHEPILRSILISHAKEGATLEEIRNDFYELEGYELPLSTERLTHILLSSPGVVCYSNYYGLFIFNILESTRSQHILSMVQKQKPAKNSRNSNKSKMNNYNEIKHGSYSSIGDLRNPGSLESIDESLSPKSSKSADSCYFRDNYQYLQSQYSGKKQQFAGTLDRLNTPPVHDSVDLTSELENEPRKGDKYDNVNIEGSQNSLDSGICDKTSLDKSASVGGELCDKNGFYPGTTTSGLSHQSWVQNSIDPSKNIHDDQANVPNVISTKNDIGSFLDSQSRKCVEGNNTYSQKNSQNINNSIDIDDRNSQNLRLECTNRSIQDTNPQPFNRKESISNLPGKLSTLERDQIDSWFKKRYDKKSYVYDPKINGYQLLGDDLFLFLARMELGCKFYPNKKVFQSGLCTSGQCISEAKQRILEAENLSKKIIVNVGSVDILHGRELVDIESDFLELIEAILNRELKPVLTTLAPLANRKQKSQRVILERFNLFIKEVGQRGNFLVIDLWSIMADPKTKMFYPCCYQQKPRKVTGSDELHVFWNVIGRQRILKEIRSATSSSRSY